MTWSQKHPGPDHGETKRFAKGAVVGLQWKKLRGQGSDKMWSKAAWDTVREIPWDSARVCRTLQAGASSKSRSNYQIQKKKELDLACTWLLGLCSARSIAFHSSIAFHRAVAHFFGSTSQSKVGRQPGGIQWNDLWLNMIGPPLQLQSGHDFGFVSPVLQRADPLMRAAGLAVTEDPNGEHWSATPEGLQRDETGENPWSPKTRET